MGDLILYETVVALNCSDIALLKYDTNSIYSYIRGCTLILRNDEIVQLSSCWHLLLFKCTQLCVLCEWFRKIQSARVSGWEMGKVWYKYETRSHFSNWRL